MVLVLAAKGFAVGLSVAAPVGPIGVLCIRRTLSSGRLSGFVSGLGAAVADGLYGGVAAFGLTVVSNALVGNQHWLRLVGGLFLLWLGVRTYRSKPAEEAVATAPRNLAGDFASTLVFTLTNPMTIISFGAVFAGLGVGSAHAGFGAAAATVGGVVLGSACWWLILSGTVGLLRIQSRPGLMKTVNRASGVVIAAFGVVALLSLL